MDVNDGLDEGEEEKAGVALSEDSELFTTFINEATEHMENVEESLCISRTRS